MTAKFDAAYDASCSIVFNSDSNITCVNPITANLTGIADYANELSTTKTIGGVPFNGSADIVPKVLILQKFLKQVINFILYVLLPQVLQMIMTVLYLLIKINYHGIPQHLH